MACLISGSWPLKQCQTWVSPYVVSLNSNQILVCYLPKYCVQSGTSKIQAKNQQCGVPSVVVQSITRVDMLVYCIGWLVIGQRNYVVCSDSSLMLLQLFPELICVLSTQGFLQFLSTWYSNLHCGKSLGIESEDRELELDSARAVFLG